MLVAGGGGERDMLLWRLEKSTGRSKYSFRDVSFANCRLKTRRASTMHATVPSSSMVRTVDGSIRSGVLISIGADRIIW